MSDCAEHEVGMSNRFCLYTHMKLLKACRLWEVILNNQNNDKHIRKLQTHIHTQTHTLICAIANHIAN